MNNLPKYPAYKDSGAEWIGDIPVQWKIRRIKHLFREINERTNSGDEELLSVSQYTGVTKKSDKIEDGDLLTTASTLEGYKKVCQGDLVSNIMLAWNGSLGFSPCDGITSPAYSIYRLIGGNIERYFHYLLRTETYKAEFKRNSSGVIDSRLRLYTDDFFRIYSILPPLEEQTTIARFLDRKTALIDQAISIKEKQIELLKERRQILIHKAVTRGLNPYVKLKDSGVEWIGEIPEDWGVKKLKYIAGSFMYGTSVDCNELEKGTPVLRIPNIRDLFINFDELKYASLSEVETKKYLLKKNDILIIRTNGNPSLVGKSALFEASDDYLFASYLIRVKPSEKIESDFLIHAMNSFSVRSSLTFSARTSAGNYNLNTQALGDCYLAYPPKIEQQGITKFIETKSSKISTAISLKEKEIEKLKEYKATLINSVVTGKIKV